MSIDYRIPGTINTGPSAFDGGQGSTMGAIMAARKDDDARQKQAQEDKDIRDALSQNTLEDGSPDFDKAINLLLPKHPEKALKLQATIQQARQQEAAARVAKTKADLEKLNQGVRFLQGVTDPDSFARTLPMISSLSPEFGQMVGTTYDPERIDALIRIGLTTEQYLNERQQALADWSAGKTDAGFLRYIKSAATPEERAAFIAEARKMGMPKPLADMIPPFGPEFRKQIEDMSLSTKDRAEIADKDRQRDETNRHNLEAEKTAAANAVANQTRAGAAMTNAVRPRPTGTGGTAPGVVDAVTKRQADGWRAEKLFDLRKQLREGDIDQDDYDTEKAEIERDYRRRIGEPDPAPTYADTSAGTPPGRTVPPGDAPAIGPQLKSGGNATVPKAVLDVLVSKAPGKIYTLGDGSRWRKKLDGSIEPAPPAKKK